MKHLAMLTLLVSLGTTLGAEEQTDKEVKEQASLKDKTGCVLAVAFSPDGKTLALGSADPSAGGPKPGSWGGEVTLWDVPTGKVRATLKGHTFDVKTIAFSPDGKTLASGSGDLFDNKAGEVKLWDVPSGKERVSLTGHADAIWSVAFSPDGKTLASASPGERSIRLWDVAAGKQRDAFKTGSQVMALAYSPDGKALALGGAKLLKLLDAATGKEISSLDTRGEDVLSVAVSSDGKTLAAGCRDGTARLLDLTTGKQRASLNQGSGAVWSVAFGNNGLLASASGSILSKKPGAVKVWNVATGTERASLPTFKRPVFAVAISPDGALLATGSGDLYEFGELTIWNLSKLPVGKPDNQAPTPRKTSSDKPEDPIEEPPIPPPSPPRKNSKP